ncbi:MULTISPECIES: TadE/TadG family type IV pilus assembly protein [unclassified Mesorhizobium]|uniref:TadE/TadG family type IV pilus assembly protein n=1 Tax=Mesorhizobium sp. LNJC398B00 TaxID=1287276 RepID=UPI0003CF3EE3|nr:TadE/TadG family type IV pilus assembly protein [Mesorhizobium sp. LNJC398B00]ESX99857.1 pilus biosynthesis protein TadE [Mesorhizobium sp. LNJC398B00]
MGGRTLRIVLDKSGIAAVEFAMLVPILCLVCLGIADGWSYVTSYLQMRAGVKTAANLVMAGASNDTGTQAVALSSWNDKPEDAAVVLVRSYLCGATVVDATTICGGTKLPTVFVQITATGTWVPPFNFGVFPDPRAISHQQVIRVR